MSSEYLNIATTDAVRAIRAQMSSDDMWASPEGAGGADALTAREVSIIGERDSFYLATVSETGWPYVQHRGGPPGFLKVIDANTLAFADYLGNRQYISAGNISRNDRAALIMVDYPRRRRLKLYVRIKTHPVDESPELAAKVIDAGYRGRPALVQTLHVVAYDWNCPQHITPRYTESEISRMSQPLREQLAALETENRELKAIISKGGTEPQTGAVRVPEVSPNADG